jgi:hypothetical protein
MSKYEIERRNGNNSYGWLQETIGLLLYISSQPNDNQQFAWPNVRGYNHAGLLMCL